MPLGHVPLGHVKSRHAARCCPVASSPVTSSRFAWCCLAKFHQAASSGLVEWSPAAGRSPVQLSRCVKCRIARFSRAARRCFVSPSKVQPLGRARFCLVTSCRFVSLRPVQQCAGLPLRWVGSSCVMSCRYVQFNSILFSRAAPQCEVTCEGVVPLRRVPCCMVSLCFSCFNLCRC